METVSYKGYKIEISQDDNPESPRNWDNLTTMICFHKRYNLGDKHEIKHQDYSSWEEMKQALIKQFKPVSIKPLYMLDHSGITISTKDFNDRWDSGQVGFVLVSRKQALECFGVKRITTEIKNKTERLMNSEVETYDNYLTGSVYRFVIKDPDGEEIDSCSGYFGDKHDKSGLLDDAHAYIEHELKKERA